MASQAAGEEAGEVAGWTRDGRGGRRDEGSGCGEGGNPVDLHDIPLMLSVSLSSTEP